MSTAEVRTCPMCGEQVGGQATECQFCGERFPKTESGPRFNRQQLRQVAVYQKGILVCILAYLAVMVFQFAVPMEGRPVLGLAVLAVGLVAMIFVILLAMKFYHPVMAVMMGLVIVIPCVGLIVLLVINQKATTLLTQRGHKVGLMGARLSQFDA